MSAISQEFIDQLSPELRAQYVFYKMTEELLPMWEENKREGLDDVENRAQCRHEYCLSYKHLSDRMSLTEQFMFTAAVNSCLMNISSWED